MKKFYPLLIASFFVLAPHVFASDFVALAPIPGLTQGVSADSVGLANFLNNLYKYLIGLSAVLAIIMIIWGGLEYATQDSPGGKSEGKERILQALLGLILILSPVLVFSIINPSILNLSLNLEPLNTVSGPSTIGAGNTASTTSPAVTAGCTTTGGGAALQRVTCTSSELAQRFVTDCNASGGSGVAIASLSSQCTTTNGVATCNSSSTAVCEKKLAGTYLGLVLNTGYLGGLLTFGAWKLQIFDSTASAYTNFGASCAQSGGSFCGTVSSASCPAGSDSRANCKNVTSVYCGYSSCTTQGGSVLAFPQ